MRYYRRPNVLKEFLKPRVNYFSSSINHSMNAFGSAVSSAVGAAVGAAVGSAINRVSAEVVDTVTNDMEIEQEKKRMKLEKEKKIQNMQARCPYCCAPTSGKEYCEYCASKLI